MDHPTLEQIAAALDRPLSPRRRELLERLALSTLLLRITQWQTWQIRVVLCRLDASRGGAEHDQDAGAAA